MRSASNFSPEWGYLAPVPSFVRTARIVLVTTAVGATAAAAVVLSLVDHPTADGEKTASASVAAHAIVTSVQVATVSEVPPAAPQMATVAPASLPAKPAPAPQIRTSAQTPAQTPAQSAITTPPPAEIASPQPAAPVAAVSSGDANGGTPRQAPGMAALSEAPPANDATPAAKDDIGIAPAMLPPQKPKHHPAGPYASNGNAAPALGNVIRHLFSAHSGPSYYPN
jgi:hypothetical protein